MSGALQLLLLIETTHALALSVFGSALVGDVTQQLQTRALVVLLALVAEHLHADLALRGAVLVHGLAAAFGITALVIEAAVIWGARS